MYKKPNVLNLTQRKKAILYCEVELTELQRYFKLYKERFSKEQPEYKILRHSRQFRKEIKAFQVVIGYLTDLVNRRTNLTD